jgi:hypothetical protein
VPELLALAAEVTPSPQAPAGLDPNDVTPGLAGFLPVLFLAIAVILLGISLVRRVRRIRYRAELEQRRAAEQQAEQETGRPTGRAAGSAPAGEGVAGERARGADPRQDGGEQPGGRPGGPPAA